MDTTEMQGFRAASIPAEHSFVTWNRAWKSTSSRCVKGMKWSNISVVVVSNKQPYGTTMMVDEGMSHSLVIWPSSSTADVGIYAFSPQVTFYVT